MEAHKCAHTLWAVADLNNVSAMKLTGRLGPLDKTRSVCQVDLFFPSLVEYESGLQLLICLIQEAQVTVKSL